MMGKGDPPDMLKKFGLAMTLGTVFVSYVFAGGLIGYFLTNGWEPRRGCFSSFSLLGPAGPFTRCFALLPSWIKFRDDLLNTGGCIFIAILLHIHLVELCFARSTKSLNCPVK